MESLWPRLCLLVLVLAAAVPGLRHLEEDGARPFALPAEDPLLLLTERLRAATGGDDLLVALVCGEGELIGPNGLAAVDSVYQRMRLQIGLERVQAVHVMPVLSMADGVLSVSTPLAELGLENQAFAEARQRVLRDPLLAGQFVAEDGRCALVLGWFQRLGSDELFERKVGQSLADAEFRSSEVGQLIDREVSGARMAAAFGDLGHSAAEEVALRLKVLQQRGGAVAQILADWRVEMEQLAADLDAGVRASLAADLAAIPGVEVLLYSAGAMESAYDRAFKEGLGILIVGLVLGLALWVSRLGGARAAAASLLLSMVILTSILGCMGHLQVPLHPLSMAGLLSALLWFVVLVLLRPQSWWNLVALGAILAAPVLVGLQGSGAVWDLRITAAIGLVVVWLAVLVWNLVVPTVVPERHSQGRPNVLKALRSVPFAGVALLIVSLTMLLARPLGLDPAALLSQPVWGDATPTVRATALLDRQFGAAAGAFLVLDGREPGAAARPAELGALAAAQTRLQGHPAVRSQRSWSDFIARLHAVVAGQPEQSLPESAELVEQYLLLFGEPERLRPFVSEDRSLAVALVRTAPGGGAELGFLSELFPPSIQQPGLAGQAVVMAVAERRTVKVMLLGLALSALLLTGLLVTRRGVGAAQTSVQIRLTVPVAVASLALAVSAQSAGALGSYGVLAGAWLLGIMGTCAWQESAGAKDRFEELAQLLLLPFSLLLVAEATVFRSMGLAVVGALCAGLVLRAPIMGQSGKPEAP